MQEEVKIGKILNWDLFQFAKYNVIIRNGCIYTIYHILISNFDHTQSLSQLWCNIQLTVNETQWFFTSPTTSKKIPTHFWITCIHVSALFGGFGFFLFIFVFCFCFSVCLVFNVWINQFTYINYLYLNKSITNSFSSRWDNRWRGQRHITPTWCEVWTPCKW